MTTWDVMEKADEVAKAVSEGARKSFDNSFSGLLFAMFPQYQDMNTIQYHAFWRVYNARMNAYRAVKEILGDAT